MIALITYDITDDQRREDVAVALSGYGPRVQLSVFECECRDADELRDLRARLREIIDPLKDQIRLYPTTTTTFSQRYILRATTVEERADYWIIR
ncbi:CRISPR-associated endonuclease Cas2 [Nocardia sp. NPDC050697]|uniref:CRISPR-associated endonuclease Cas2 n=1 Tax=Nocardia sp. NPDC050697 TaxID=3155158 RepID=UPI00340E5D58